jgi:hypothetical protein
VVSAPIVRLIFQHGKFNAESTHDRRRSCSRASSVFHRENRVAGFCSLREARTP